MALMVASAARGGQVDLDAEWVMAEGLGQCAKSTRRANLSDFTVFPRIGPEGTLEEVLVKPATNVALCVLHRLERWKAPSAPSAD